MATPTAPIDPGPRSRTLVEFPDNRLLIDLCGDYDRNLAAIEQQLEVQILRRGNHLAFWARREAARRRGAACAL